MLERRARDAKDATARGSASSRLPKSWRWTSRRADALRRKKDSSLRVAIELVKNGEADACVSAGNTGALMATARYVLKTLPGIDRPAIISAVPGRRAADTTCSISAPTSVARSQHLLQFALMGSVVAGDMLDVARPRVGLLNIGDEDIKGNEMVREAGELLAQQRPELHRLRRRATESFMRTSTSSSATVSSATWR